MAQEAQDHPIEHIYQARDALMRAQSAQARNGTPGQTDDPAALGSAIIGVLDATHALTCEICEHVEDIDRHLASPRAYRDHPDLVLDEAGQYLRHLRSLLRTAVADAGSYSHKAEQVRSDLREPTN